MTRFLLMGSGEFLPWSNEAERFALDLTLRTGPIAILPTASAPEGDQVFNRWANMALAHYASLNLPARLVGLKSREDAADPELTAAVDGASMVFFSGGNPVHLHDTLDGTPFLDAITRALARGAVFAGCSAGAMVASARAVGAGGPSFRSAGLGLVPHVRFGVHWNRVPGFPGSKRFMVAGVERTDSFIGIDEMTAIVGDGVEWLVFGQGRVEVRRLGKRTRFGAGDEFSLA
ncbi:MAG: Type 1 glutamine amidotransferase-like domain-containing protein [Candidatus Dormiibacterota bacterium]